MLATIILLQREGRSVEGSHEESDEAVKIQWAKKGQPRRQAQVPPDQGAHATYGNPLRQPCTPAMLPVLTTLAAISALAQGRNVPLYPANALLR